MKLKVGMYAYSKHSRDYGIGKIVNIHTNGFTHQEVEIQYKDIKISTRYDYVIGSNEPIDLIEVGDYVNDSYIQEIISIKNNEMKCMLDSDYELISTIKNEDIETIVTKEQFSQMEYKI